ncbi:hypothetical protein GGQ64_000070 [Rhizobium azooxidifex]|uniref:Uncharacterized protein n=1 Tax=Mycoplana azooxidifex TaxID=1636188 RepID=A0A7W6D9R7_9HYPH|nr:hypothetical protein [Mycoplana azooxidifex]
MLQKCAGQLPLGKADNPLSSVYRDAAIVCVHPRRALACA